MMGEEKWGVVWGIQKARESIKLKRIFSVQKEYIPTIKLPIY